MLSPGIVDFFSPQLCAQLHELHIVYFFNSWTVWTSVVAMAFLLALFVIESAALEVARSSRSSCRGGQVPWPTGPAGCEEMGPAKERAMKFLEENMPPWDVINKGTLKPGVRIRLRCCCAIFFFFQTFPHLIPFACELYRYHTLKTWSSWRASSSASFVCWLLWDLSPFLLVWCK